MSNLERPLRPTLQAAVRLIAVRRSFLRTQIDHIPVFLRLSRDLDVKLALRGHEIQLGGLVWELNTDFFQVVPRLFLSAY